MPQWRYKLLWLGELFLSDCRKVSLVLSIGREKGIEVLTDYEVADRNDQLEDQADPEPGVPEAGKIGCDTGKCWALEAQKD